ncbi:putative fucolectin-like protein [Labeo rohita]|uniref:Putative fucolectin-like protein n=1 Tax=Labeo rohita TaxID=84645 RepID=A0A498LFF9_LABRO|nr:putative fucolectin-like protein [Labeo rohita]
MVARIPLHLLLLVPQPIGRATRGGGWIYRCAVISSNSAANSFIYSCSDREGQYVNVFMNEWSDFLSVCEVEVYESDISRQYFIKMMFNSTANLTDPTVTDSVLSELKSALGITNVTLSWSQSPEEEITVIQNEHENENLARKGIAAQSTIFGDLIAHRAIDGGKDISMTSSSCAATYLEARPWWRLDLQAEFRVSIVVVTYREDCCPDNRRDFEIRFGSSLQDNGNTNPSCAAISSDAVANSVTYSCSDRKGQYVNILLNGLFKAIFVCEVEVYESVQMHLSAACECFRFMIIKRFYVMAPAYSFVDKQKRLKLHF